MKYKHYYLIWKIPTSLEMSRDNDQKRKESPYMELLRNNNQKDAYISNEKQLQNHSLTFIR